MWCEHSLKLSLLAGHPNRVLAQDPNLQTRLVETGWFQHPLLHHNKLQNISPSSDNLQFFVYMVALIFLFFFFLLTHSLDRTFCLRPCLQVPHPNTYFWNIYTVEPWRDLEAGTLSSHAYQHQPVGCQVRTSIILDHGVATGLANRVLLPATGTVSRIVLPHRSTWQHWIMKKTNCIARHPQSPPLSSPAKEKQIERPTPQCFCNGWSGALGHS